MSNEETILAILQDQREDTRTIHEKLDGIILRNSTADANIAVLTTKFESHEKSDNERFIKVEKKVSRHDGYWWGSLIFLVITLVGVVAKLLNLK